MRAGSAWGFDAAFPPETLAYFKTVGGEIAREVSVGSTVSFPTRGNPRWRGQIRALEGNFPFYGELGSVNPVFLLPGALKERALSA